MSGGGRCAHPDPAFGCLAVHTIAHHKDRLGWIAPEAKLTPAPGAAAGFVLERLAKPRSASYLMAEIPIVGSPTRSYTVEARLPAGYDQEIPGAGVIVHEVDTAGADRPARVVDTDANGDPNDAGATWQPGEAFVDTASDISVFVDGATPTGFQVMVLTSGVRLAVRRAGDGAGRVTSDPAGIDCGATCAAAWPRGTAVRLRGRPTRRRCSRSGPGATR
jgi:hypothetical protein